jgi:hypothetical protein
MRDKLIEAVRRDSVVGRGTCSSIDECYSDDELWEVISEAKSEEEAVRIAREDEGLWLDRACDARWGEDDDPQLGWKQDFEEGCEKHPVKD